MREFLTDLSQTPLALALATSSWVVPAMQSIHIISIAIIFMSVLIIALRVLGFAWGDTSMHQTLDRFAPWATLALIVLACTGVVLIIAEPIRELMAISFWVKMALLVIAIIISLRFIRAVRGDAGFAEPDVVANSTLRRNALATIVIWVAIIFMGRFIAYDPLIWGSLSPISS
jgi:putative copper export protein